MAVVFQYDLLLVLAFLYPIALGIYRIYFHPLSKFPGPKLAAATKWYEAWFDLGKGIGGQFSKEVDRMHRVYGPIVRINPHELHVSDPEWFDVLYAGQPNPRDKWPAAAAMLGTNFGTFGTVDHHLHRKRRTATSMFFSKRSITASEPIIHTHLERFCDYIKEHRKEVLHLRVRFLAFTSDVLCNWAFGKSFDMQLDDASADEFDATLSAVATVAPFVKQFPWAIQYGFNLPLRIVRVVAPPLAKVLAMKHVGNIIHVEL
jgi:cytochrome P450